MKVERGHIVEAVHAYLNLAWGKDGMSSLPGGR